MALASRFSSTCRMRVGSPMTWSCPPVSDEMRQRVAAVLGHASLAFDQLAHQRGQREGLFGDDDLAGLGARDLEHGVDVMQQQAPRGADDVEILAVLCRTLTRVEQVERAEHPVQGGPHLVAHDGDQVGLGLFSGHGFRRGP